MTGGGTTSEARVCRPARTAPDTTSSVGTAAQHHAPTDRRLAMLARRPLSLSVRHTMNLLSRFAATSALSAAVSVRADVQPREARRR
jgi:hypothetical protein